MALSVSDRISGFIIKSIDYIEEISARGILCVHERTGAQVYHIHNDDRENLFCFAFKTLPSDDKGIPHILEHSVLCGSESFPVKDPFAFLMRSSLATFLNAMTYPDRTLYPAGSVVEKDYFNLMRVYGDAVFFPLLKREAFLQEGHRLELTDGGLKRVGVVYNEMKGVFSDADALSADMSIRGLFPDCELGYESGGVPEAIAKLSYDEFMDFYHRNYSPSACRIILYGNIETEKQLEFLDSVFFSRMTASLPASGTVFQPDFSSPVRREEFYGAAKDAAPDEDFIVSVNWRTAPLYDMESVIALEVLSEILLGSDAAPLRKALLESGLGEDVAPSTGFENELIYSIFSAGLKGVSETDVDAVESLVLDCLSSFAREGLPKDNIEAAFRKIEFRYRELYGKRNAGLVYMRRILRGWLYDILPSFLVDFFTVFNRVKMLASADSSYFSSLIKRWLVDNNNRLTLVMRPRPGMLEEEEQKEKEELDKLYKSLSENEIERIKKDSALVSEFQSADDRELASSCIPVLDMDALPRKVETIEQKKDIVSGVTVYHQPIDTRGIVYLDMHVSLDSLSDEELFYVPLLVDMLEGTSTDDLSYDDITVRLDMLTGGLSVNEDASRAMDGSVVSGLIIRVKMLESMVDQAIPFIVSYLSSANVADKDRLKLVLGECRQDFVSSVVSAANSFMSLRAEAAFSPAMAMEERFKGISQFFFLDALDKGMVPAKPSDCIWEQPSDKSGDFSDIADKVGSVLSSLKDRVFCRENVVLSVTGRGSAADRAVKMLATWAAALPASSHSSSLRSVLDMPQWQGFSAPSKVAYVAACMPSPCLGEDGFSELAVTSQALKSGLLWERIRMKGGAYGASASLSALEGTWSFSSYRDPNSLATIKAYEDILKDVSNGAISQSEVEQAVRGLVGREIAPQSPASRGYTALRRALLGITDELRQKHRDAVLSCTADRVCSAASMLVDSWKKRKIAVLGDSSRIDELIKLDAAGKVIEVRL